MKTVDTFFLPDETDEEKSKHHPQSKVLQQHNKAGSHEESFATLMNENFKITCDLETYVPCCSESLEPDLPPATFI